MQWTKKKTANEIAREAIKWTRDSKARPVVYGKVTEVGRRYAMERLRICGEYTQEELDAVLTEITRIEIGAA